MSPLAQSLALSAERRKNLIGVIKKVATSVPKKLDSRFRGNDRRGVIFDGAQRGISL